MLEVPVVALSLCAPCNRLYRTDTAGAGWRRVRSRAERGPFNRLHSTTRSPSGMKSQRRSNCFVGERALEGA